MKEVVLPFGKYKGQNVVDVAAADPGYLTWVSAQQNLRDTHPSVIEAIDSLSGGTDATPVHNQIQAAFMNEDFAVQALSTLLDKVTEAREEEILYAQEIVDNMSPLPDGTFYFEAEYNCKSFEVVNMNSEEGFSRALGLPDGLNATEEIGCISGYRSGTRLNDYTLEESMTVDGFEIFCDVTLSYSGEFSFAYDFVRAVIAFTQDDSAGYKVRDEEVIHCRESTSISRCFGVEIKPTVGDEYPTIMRQMSAQRMLLRKSRNPAWHMHVLYTRDNVSSLSDKLLIDMFAKNDIYMIIDRETELPT